MPGEVLFLDEIHRMARPAEEMLYVAMEDFRVDVVVGKGAGATAIPLDLAPFTLVGATTRAGLLPGPLRDRFGFTAHMDFYGDDELRDHRRALRGTAWCGRWLDRRLHGDRQPLAGNPARGQPAAAPGPRLRRASTATGVVDRATAHAALDLFEVDVLGLDRLDRAVLTALLRTFRGGPVGLSTLAVAVGEEPETVETVAEPFLVRAGLIYRTPRGRVATPEAWRAPGPGAAARPARPRSRGRRRRPRSAACCRSRGSRRTSLTVAGRPPPRSPLSRICPVPSRRDRTCVLPTAHGENARG